MASPQSGGVDRCSLSSARILAWSPMARTLERWCTTARSSWSRASRCCTSGGGSPCAVYHPDMAMSTAGVRLRAHWDAETGLEGSKPQQKKRPAPCQERPAHAVIGRPRGYGRRLCRVASTAWGIRTPDLLLEREVSWASRRMRHTTLQATIAETAVLSSTTSACEMALAGRTRAFASPTVSLVVRMALLASPGGIVPEAAVAGLPRLVVRP